MMTLPSIARITNEPAEALKSEKGVFTPVTSIEMSQYFSDSVFVRFADLHAKRLGAMTRARACFEQIETGDLTVSKLKALMAEGDELFSQAKGCFGLFDEYALKVRRIREKRRMPAPQRSSIVTAVYSRAELKEYARGFVKTQMAEERAKQRFRIINNSAQDVPSGLSSSHH